MEDQIRKDKEKKNSSEILISKLFNWSGLHLIAGIAVFIIIIGSIALLLKISIPSQISGKSSDAMLNNIINQQGVVQTFFSTLITIMITLMALITGLGYFNTRKVRKKADEINDTKQKADNILNEIKSRYEPFKKQLDNLIDLHQRLEQQYNDLNKLEIPDSINAISLGQYQYVKNAVIKINILEMAGFEKTIKSDYFLAIDFYLNNLFDESSREVSIIANTDTDPEIKLLASFLQGMIYYKLKKYYEAVDVFIKIISNDNNFLAAYYYIAESWEQIKTIDETGNIDISDQIIFWTNKIFNDHKHDDKNEFSKKVSQLYLFRKYCPDKIFDLIDSISAPVSNRSTLDLLRYESKAFSCLETRDGYLYRGEEEKYEEVKIENLRIFNEAIQDALNIANTFKHYLAYESNIYQQYKMDCNSDVYLKEKNINYGMLTE
jgi:hypothetical protein